MISILLPTHDRPKACRESIKSLLDLAVDPERIQFCIYIDLQDQSYDLSKLPDTPLVLVRGDRYGYANLGKYYNELGRVSSGDWLMVWNDDALMETKQWDKIIRNYDASVPVMLATRSQQRKARNSFPVISRPFFDAVGFGPTYAVDTWVDDVAALSASALTVPIEILHDRSDLTGNNDDQTFKDRIYDRKLYDSKPMKALRLADAKRVRLLK